MGLEGKHILVTGGAGYIGSHTVLELLNQGAQVTAIDNLSNSKLESIERVQEISGRPVNFKEIDLRHASDDNAAKLESVFAESDIDAVVHFAGLKAVGESNKKPLEYYDNNLAGTIHLLKLMDKYDTKKLVFSSSATVYGASKSDHTAEPMIEDMPTAATNPYGRTKHMIEQVLEDVYASTDTPEWDITSLRYFNPVGAHESGRIGEDPNGIPNNLMPFISQVAVGRREELQVFGNDYGTKPDGTGIRDYIHVCDLAQGHTAALAKMFASDKNEHNVYNLGSGKGTSVLELVNAFSKASGKPINYRIAPRRQGDVAKLVADPRKAQRELQWHTTRGIDQMCEDTWRWQSQNPNGYEEKSVK